jgi:CRP-like cAMP-binding protein
LKSSQNQLIDGLPMRERKRLLALCQPVELVLSDVLYEAGTPTKQAYFPTEGFISLVAQVDSHTGLEMGMVGNEGMVGAQLALGVQKSPLRAVVQGAGACLSIGASPFTALLADSQPLQRELARYVHVMMIQSAALAGCLRFHMIAPRLARWLLMSQDRAGNSQFRVTHEFLAYMLGVRRVGVTVAAGALQRQGLISYHRGDLTVLDRGGLEAAACSCYASDLAAYAEYLP